MFPVLLIVCLLCGSCHKAAAQMLLVDISDSLSVGEASYIQKTIKGLNERYISVTYWSSITTEYTFFGVAHYVASKMPNVHGLTELGKILTKRLKEKIVCEHIIVVVHGATKDLDDYWAAVPELLNQNRLTVLVLPDGSDGISDYTSIYANGFTHEHYLIEVFDPENLKLSLDQPSLCFM